MPWTRALASSHATFFSVSLEVPRIAMQYSAVPGIRFQDGILFSNGLMISLPEARKKRDKGARARAEEKRQ